MMMMGVYRFTMWLSVVGILPYLMVRVLGSNMQCLEQIHNINTTLGLVSITLTSIRVPNIVAFFSARYCVRMKQVTAAVGEVRYQVGFVAGGWLKTLA